MEFVEGRICARGGLDYIDKKTVVVLEKTLEVRISLPISCTFV